jgi:hypothetical protein
MIRPLRRAHLGIVVPLALATALGVEAAARGRAPRLSLLPAAALVPPTLGGLVTAAAAWPVGADTLYLELARSGGDAVPEARVTTSAGARWPDAVLYWSPGLDSLNALPAGAVPLGVVGVGTSLVVRLPAPGGALHLYSVAWQRHLGAWASPLNGGGS